MQKHISADEMTRMRVVIITLDGHLASVVRKVARRLADTTYPGLELSLHIAADWHSDPAALERCRDAIRNGDIIFVNMLFMDDHIRAVLPTLEARRGDCDAMVGCVAAGEVVRMTRLGRFSLDKEPGGAMALLKKLRGSKSSQDSGSSAASQMRMLRRIPQTLKYIPGTA